MISAAGRITRILSSSGPGSLRPSRLLVVTHSEPSGARTTARSRPNSPVKCAVGVPTAPVRSSGTCQSRIPRSAATQRLPAAIAAPDGDASSVGQVSWGSVYLPSWPAPSTTGQP